MPERAPSRRAARASCSKSLAFSAGEAGLLGACADYSDTLLAKVEKRRNMAKRLTQMVACAG